ncbi:MAG: TFIIB-type zinc ribbon-containing protein [Lachnospiraceae bacterium]|nr:TFIIB-type zinc ribbon-containing protein [Lachnospiraceae bacterium]
MAVISYKCPNCDGELVFHPATQKYKCEYCASAFSQEELAQLKPATEEEQRVSESPQEEQTERGQKENGRYGNREAGEQQSQEEGVMYHCPSCGAQIVTDQTTAAAFCYYCHNPVVLSGRVSGEFLPHKIIPFTIDKQQATEKFLEYAHSKKFVPKAFFNKQQIEKISGVYFPYWMADMDMIGSLQAEGKNLRVWRSGDTEYTETKIYHVERRGNIHLEDITKNALKKNSLKLAEGVLPYDVSKVKGFHMGYLSGFLAEKRDLGRSDLQAEVVEDAKEFAQRLLRETAGGYGHLSVNSCQLQTQQEHWDYIMLPVWTVTYKGRDGKMYYYSMNGQNGKVYGELPVDGAKVWILGIVIFMVVFLLGLLGGWML